MSNLVMWNLVVGFVVPNLIALLQQPKFSNAARALITFAVSIVGGLGTAYFNDQWNPADIVGSILVVAVAAITFYRGFWKPTGVAPTIELATAPADERNAVRQNARHRGDEGYSAVEVALLVLLVLVIIYIVVAWLIPALQ